MTENRIALAILAVALALAGLLVGLVRVYGSDEIGREVRQYRITYVDPPKHVWINVYDIETLEEYRQVSVSKHCNRWREIAIGSTVSLVRVTYKQRTGGEVWTSVQGRSSICPGN